METISINYTNSSPDTTYAGKYFANYLDIVDMSARDLCILMSAVDTILTMEWRTRCE